MEKVDLRASILRSAADKKVTACMIADGAGIVSGTGLAKKEARRLGLSLKRMCSEGAQVRKGDEIVRFCGSPRQVVMAEEVLIGCIAKPSGIATAAHKFLEATGGRPRIVCGAWKKMPPSLKDVVRRAVITGGASYRISSSSFVYLDKNYIQLLGGIKESLRAVAHLNGHLKVVQLKGRSKDILIEACEAVDFGADILFIDTGRREDVKLVVERLLELGVRNKLKIAFGGGVRLEDISELKAIDVDILCVGRQIVDAPLLDVRLEILGVE